jgi:ribose 5-phosphate isomerase B
MEDRDIILPNVVVVQLNIAVGSDHRGFALKRAAIHVVEQMGHRIEDFGCYDDSSTDYPDIAEKVACAVADGRCERGILVCSTGIGMSIAANKIKGVRAALCHDLFTARCSRQHNDANVLCLGGSVVGQDLAEEMVKEFLGTEFEGDRHKRRVGKIAALEGKDG